MQTLDKSFMFIKSALHLEGSFHSIEEVKKWVTSQNKKINVNVSRIKFEELDQWSFSKETHNLKHHSGKFFSIDGIDVKTNWRSVSHWQQPIINQPHTPPICISARSSSAGRRGRRMRRSGAVL